jgi:hypothetical protein
MCTRAQCTCNVPIHSKGKDKNMKFALEQAMKAQRGS